jgi:hypothetical protein
VTYAGTRASTPAEMPATIDPGSKDVPAKGEDAPLEKKKQ